MAAISKNARVCETCGSPIETTSAGDLGCIACLIATGLDAEAEQSDTAFASAPDQLGAYTIKHHADGSVWELGRGAMGVTYRAIDKALDRTVALKIINTERGSHSAEARERFMREARAAAALRHPNVATVYQFGVREETGQFFYAMELVEGETLEERVRRLGPLDVLTTIDIALQVTAALEAAEARGLVHRDLKPGNLMLVGGCDNGEEVGRNHSLLAAASARQKRTARSAVPTVKVIDFGVAKAIADKTNPMAITHGGFVGTPAFASPEQFTNAPVDVRSDIYSLGATLWFLLTGQMPFSGRTIEEIRDARRSKPLPIDQLEAARVPRRFVSLLISMLAIEPAARPAGARELSAKLQAIRILITGRGKTARRLALAAAIVVLATIIAIRVFHSSATKATPSAIPEKSIAVLPFENLSRDPDNAYFAEGIQEEILTRLASIAGLRVISRTSTQRYHNKPRNLREIAEQLGVANILEGSVQKATGQVRVNVQLINAQTDSHLWADTYDRKLTDILGVESEIAKRIAESLLAWARLCRADALVYFNHADNSYAARGDAAKRALENAQRLEPNSAQTQLALGYYQYQVLVDYGSAKTTFERISKMLPGNSEVLFALGSVARREGQWAEGIARLDQASSLDPANVNLITDLAWTHGMLRQLPAALKLYDRALDITPYDPEVMAKKAGIYQAQGNLHEAARLLSEINPLTLNEQGFAIKVAQLKLERNYTEAVRLLQTRQAQFDFGSQFAKLLDQVTLALMERLAGDTAGGTATADQARQTLEKLYNNQPDNFVLAANLSQLYAVMGKKDSAFKTAERAIMLLPRDKDRVNGPTLEHNLALIQTIFGENSRAISTLTQLLQTPYNCSGWVHGPMPVTPALLKLDPFWDPLRGDPAFQKLCEEKQK